MSDTTKAAKMLNEFGSPSIPPPPASGSLPFSIPFNDSKQGVVYGSKSGSGGNANADAAVLPAEEKDKSKWIVIKEKCTSVLKKQGIAAIVVFVIVAGIMAAVNPPIVQTKSKNPDEKPKRNAIKILIWASVAALLAVMIPLGIEYSKKKKSTATVSSAP